MCSKPYLLGLEQIPVYKSSPEFQLLSAATQCFQILTCRFAYWDLFRPRQT